MNNHEFNKMFELEKTHFWFVGKRMFIKKYLDPIKTSIQTILDIGSGTGGTTKWLNQYGKIIGLEKNLYSVTLGKKRSIEIILADAQKLPFQKESFDLVTLLDVLYHKEVLNIDAVLNEVYRVLKPNGYVLLTDSALPFLYSRHDILLFGKRRFTLNQLKKHLTRLGFQINKSSYIYFFIFPILFIKRKIVDCIFPPKSSDVVNTNIYINQLLIAVLKLESIILQYISFPIGSSVIILAQKKSVNNL